MNRSRSTTPSAVIRDMKPLLSVASVSPVPQLLTKYTSWSGSYRTASGSVNPPGDAMGRAESGRVAVVPLSGVALSDPDPEQAATTAEATTAVRFERMGSPR
jgi:hypothetical protein